MKREGRILINRDSPSHSETREMFKYVKRGEILLPAHLQRELDEYCQGCGTAFSKAKGQRSYFGQVFCVECVDRWTSK